MGRKRFHLTLFQKALILVAVPLAFELLLLATLNGLLQEAEREARQADHAKTVIARTSDVIELLFNTGIAILAYDASSNPLFERRYVKLSGEIPGALDKLRELVKGNPRHRFILAEVSAEAGEAMKTLSEVKRRLDQGERLNLVHAYQLRERLNKSVERLNVIIADEKAAQNVNPDASAKLKAMTMQLIHFGVVASVVLALVLVAVFHQGTARRLKTLMDNSGRLGRREPLAPLLEGEDEIARLDRVFHEAAVAIAEAQRKERAAIENAADVICSIDADGTLTAVSPACWRLWGYKPEELVGRFWLELVEQGDAEASRRWAEKVREKAQSGPMENKVLRKDGSSIDMRWSGHWSESEQSLFCVAHDVTERKELERFKQQFVAMVSHDLRTPLSAVQSTLSLLGTGAWGALSERGQQKVTSAKRNIHESINLINDLLDLEKMEAGKLELDIEETPLLAILQRSADSVAALAESRGIKLELPAADAVVLADSGRLSQVMVNLIGNAVKFSPDGGTVTVGLMESADWVEIRVSDQGPGIPEAYQQAVFERFQQVPGASSKRGGTGLGLPICKAIIEAHGGSIGVQSEEGKGSTFWVRVPT